MPFVRVGQVEAFGLNVVMRPLQAGIANSRGVYQGRDVFNMRSGETVEEVDVAVAQAAKVYVFVDALLSLSKLFQTSLELYVLILDRWGNQAMRSVEPADGNCIRRIELSYLWCTI